MRVRVISRGMSGLLYVKELFNPIKYGFISFQLFSHKVLRWLIPIFMIILFITNIFLLENRFYVITFLIQIVFYSFAFLGWIFDFLNIKMKIFSIPLFFCVVNMASMISLTRTIFRKKVVTWEPIRN